MADNNRNRKRKSDTNLENPSNNETDNKNQQDEDGAEPLAKHPKTTDPEPNLEIDVANAIEEDKTDKPENSIENDISEEANIPEDIDPIITITFSNELVAEKYQEKFLTFLNKFTDLTHMHSENKIIVMECVKEIKSKKSKSKVKKELFTVDTAPTAKGKGFTPKYSSKFKVKEDEVEEEQINVSVCFNCDGNHSLRDCSAPKNMNKIRSARLKFNNNKPSYAKSARYHIEEDQRFAHLIPGKLSDKLRHALGLRKYDTPPYVYKMRCLGYPPGWLEEAKVVHSNLSIFDIDGKNVKKVAEKKGRIDPEKIIDYPGFNVKMEKGFKDNCNHYGVPQFSDMFSKEAMINCILKMQDDEETCDMDIDDSDKDDSPARGSEIGENGGRISPTLTDLEKQKNQLLAELTDENSTNDSNSKSTIEETKQSIDASLNATAENEIVADTPSKVKTSSFGTPIIKSLTPFICLPNPDNFMKDVSPVINFENLPNSTGKYEQMTGVLDKVRKTLKLMEKENT